MQKLILIFTLCTILPSKAQENKPHIDFMAATPEINSILNSYEDFYLFLLEQDNLEIQLSIPTYSYRKFTEEYTQTYKKVLKKAININSSPFAIYRADTICHTYSSLTDWCHELNIHTIHQQIDPNNLITYLLSMHKDNQNNEQILSTAVENSEFSDSFFYHNIFELIPYIESYITQIPI